MHSDNDEMTGVGAFIFGCAGTRLTDRERAFFADCQPFGFILFARNLEYPEAIRRLADELRSAVGRDVLILIDQEGGRVQRLAGAPWREWLPPYDQCAMLPRAAGAEALRLRYEIIASELRALGIDVNCVPVADVATSETHEILFNRCYSRDPAEVAVYGRAVADGCLRGGVLPVLKHIPGHGRPNADSHLELPVTDAPLEELRASDFVPFRALRDLPMGMTGHVVYSGIDAERPATQSKTVIELVRTEIGFDGLLMSDDLSMCALKGGMRDRTRRSIDAGCDIVLHCNGDMREMREVASEAGVCRTSAAARAERAMAARTEAPTDIRAAIGEFESIMDAHAAK